jgi:hypothetical protein
LDEKEAEGLWAEEARRRLDAARDGRARTVRAEDVARKVENLLP